MENVPPRAGIAQDLSPQFTASVVLMCAGTALLFFSLSGFLVRLAKLIPSLYLRGLAPFTVQQLASRVNTAFASLTVVCMVLFVALTSVQRFGPARCHRIFAVERYAVWHERDIVFVRRLCDGRGSEPLYKLCRIA